MQAIEDVVGEEDWEEIGSSDVSAYVQMIGDHLRERQGSREEMDRRRPFAEEQDTEPDEEQAELNRDGEPDHGLFGDDEDEEDEQGVAEGGFFDPDKPEIGSMVKHRNGATGRVKKIGTQGDETWIYFKDKNGEMNSGLWKKHVFPLEEQGVSEGKAAATEDILSAVKARLGDYIQDVATAIKKDPDLLDRLPGSVDQIRAVKTIRTDDGHEIKIHGTEDDGFRISIKNKDAKTKFDNLDEAVMAVEMYCARRKQQALEADYIEEKKS